MLQPLLVTFREGIESFLIIAVIAAYLKKTHRAELMRGVRVGLAISVVTCLAGAWLWLQLPNTPLFEGISALAAAVIVGAFLIQMLRVGRQMKGQIEARVDRMTGGNRDGNSDGKSVSLRAQAGIALITALLVTREGLEAVIYLGAQAMAVRAAEVPSHAVMVAGGAAAGFVAAGVVAWSWTRWGHKLNLGVILKVTALFLAIFLVQLVVYGIHELAESGVIEGSQTFHDATEVLGPDGVVGHILSYSLLGAPLIYLVWSRRAKTRPRTAATA